jgi:GNAT superfamily N-acetyltransferase
MAVAYREPTALDLAHPVFQGVMPLNAQGRGWFISTKVLRGAVLFAFDGADLVGHCIVEPDEASAFLLVHPKWQKVGVGTALAQATVDLALKKGFKSVNARARPGTGGAAVAARLAFRQTVTLPSGELLYEYP